MTESREKYALIPDELKELAQWIVWGVDRENPKSPYTPFSSVLTPNNGRHAKADDAATWGSFDAAKTSAVRLGRGGIGFEFGVSPCGYVGIDIDGCIQEDGTLTSMAAEIVSLMNSYTEVSPSGRGLHILCKSEVSLSEIGKRNRNAELGLEIYDSRRYFTVTGRLFGDVKPLAERTKELREVYSRYMPKSENRSLVWEYNPEDYTHNASSTAELSDSELWQRMFNSETGAKIRALYSGDISSYESHSQADSALCCYLAYWTGGDGKRIDRMFRQSGLMRDKWEREDYRTGTIAHALQIIPREESERLAGAGKEEKGEDKEDCANWAESRDGEQEAEGKEESQEDATEESAKEEAEHIKTVAECLNEFLSELDKSREGKAIPTGFTELDKLLYGGLYPGLYSIGAISSLGKTTLVMQIADNIAKAGHEVLIFSLEMSRSELMAKTLSRESLMRDLELYGVTSNAMTTRGVLSASFHGDERKERLIQEAIESYRDWGRKLTIIEGVGDIGIIRGGQKGEKSLVRTLEKYALEHPNKPPVVVVDYLQILAPMNERATDKQNIDRNITWLKRLSRDCQLPIIGISSFNRENYNAPVSMASFKESGAIEYSSDVLIGLQIDGIDRASGEKEAEYKERLQRTLDTVEVCKSKGEPIAIEAKILKHRNGRTGVVHFEFYSRYNYFKERGAGIL
ncbi:MAG: hypothetical protein II876_08055 [Synergistaceae bacterium]|nr:hypothetical protein [Synergistaceae bacterium]